MHSILFSLFLSDFYVLDYITPYYTFWGGKLDCTPCYVILDVVRSAELHLIVWHFRLDLPILGSSQVTHEYWCKLNFVHLCKLLWDLDCTHGQLSWGSFCSRCYYRVLHLDRVVGEQDSKWLPWDNVHSRHLYQCNLYHCVLPAIIES